MLEIKITLFIVKQLQVHVLLNKVLLLIWQKKKKTPENMISHIVTWISRVNWAYIPVKYIKLVKNFSAMNNFHNKEKTLQYLSIHFCVTIYVSHKFFQVTELFLPLPGIAVSEVVSVGHQQDVLSKQLGLLLKLLPQ